METEIHKLTIRQTTPAASRPSRVIRMPSSSTPSQRFNAWPSRLAFMIPQTPMIASSSVGKSGAWKIKAPEEKTRFPQYPTISCNRFAIASLSAFGVCDGTGPSEQAAHRLCRPFVVVATDQNLPARLRLDHHKARLLRRGRECVIVCILRAAVFPEPALPRASVFGRGVHAAARSPLRARYVTGVPALLCASR
jgi:hypothetical protein